MSSILTYGTILEEFQWLASQAHFSLCADLPNFYAALRRFASLEAISHEGRRQICEKSCPSLNI
ncbi:MAG: hypothetical protein J0I19_17390 [Alphaproteobacteria bacterium]|nr:hypothetical protein [Alphaproteobacteria bacterium]